MNGKHSFIITLNKYSYKVWKYIHLKNRNLIIYIINLYNII